MELLDFILDMDLKKIANRIEVKAYKKAKKPYFNVENAKTTDF